MLQKNQKRIAHSVLQDLADTETRPTKYKELTYTDGNLVKIEVFDDAPKEELLFTKDLTYTDGFLTEVLVTRERDAATGMKTLTYDAGGNLIDVVVI